MAVFAVRIIKRELFEGLETEFGNTYHYLTTLGEPFSDAGVASALATAEKAVTSSAVDFVRYETWGPTEGSAFDNVIRERGTLSGTGSGNDVPGMYRECCAVVAWELPRSPSTNRRRWCRKFIRVPAWAAGSWTTAQLAGQAAIPAGYVTALTTYGNAVASVTVSANTYELCTKNGVAVSSGPLPRTYLKTREIGR